MDKHNPETPNTLSEKVLLSAYHTKASFYE